MTSFADTKSLDPSTIEPPPPEEQMSDDALPVMGTTQDITFAYVLVAFEMLYMFVKTSCDFFLLHGLARFIIDRNELSILQDIAHIKFVAGFLVIPFAILCDSYLGNYMFYLLMSGLCSIIIMPSLYFAMSFPAYMLPGSQKLNMYFAANVLHGMSFLLEPVRVVVVIKSVMVRYRFQSKRYFCAILVYGWKLATVVAACGLYIARSSRMCYSILMIINIVCLCLYVSFLLVFKHIFFPQRKQNYFCVEKVFANALCYFFKKIDQLCCKQRTFKTPGWRDFRSFKFSERTALNTHAYVGVLLVMIPLTTYYVMEMFLEFYYFTQFPMLRYETEPFPALGLEAAGYCLISPILEYFLFPQLKKLFKHETGLQLTFVGIGVFFFAIALFWCSVVQHRITNKMDFINYGSNTGHVVMVNAVSSTVTIRGKYYNEFMSWPEDNWFELIPWVPLKILYIPESEVPFKVTVSCKIFGMYDDYELPVNKSHYNWFLILPHGVVKLPVGTFHSRRDVAIKPDLYDPATVNILCRIPICAGFLVFKKSDLLQIHQVVRSSQSMITLQIVGKFQISFELVGNKSNAAAIEATFERLGVYLLVIHIDEHKNMSLNWKRGDISPSTVIRTAITLVGTNVPRSQSHAYVYPTTIIHAIGDSLVKVSIMTWLYFVAPVDLRVLCFSLENALKFPVYAYVELAGSERLQQALPVAIFSFACGCCLVTVFFFFAAIYHTHKWHSGINVPRVKRESFLEKRQKRESLISDRSKEA